MNRFIFFKWMIFHDKKGFFFYFLQVCNTGITFAQPSEGLAAQLVELL